MGFLSCAGLADAEGRFSAPDSTIVFYGRLFQHGAHGVQNLPIQTKPAIVWVFDGQDSRDLIKELEADGWRYIGATGSHHHFKHSVKPGKVTVPHPKRDLHPKTVRSIYRQTGLKEPR